MDSQLDSRQQVTQSVLRDLVNLLLREGLLQRSEPLPGLRRWLPLAGGERHFCARLSSGPEAGKHAAFRVHPAPPADCERLSRPPVLMVDRQSGRARPLTATELLSGVAGDNSWPNLVGVLGDLDLAVDHGEQTLSAEAAVLGAVEGSRPSLLDWERLAALGERPFHPTARAKQGWTSRDYRRFAPEFGRSFGLSWVAVRHDHLLTAGPDGEPADVLLDPASHQRLREGSRSGTQAEDYVPLPVHPWQLEHVVLSLYAPEIASRVCVPLPDELGGFVATSSVRTLAPPTGGAIHVKLPLGVFSLGALRLLPPRYLHNAARAQDLMERLMDTDAGLARRLGLCDERSWWAFSAGNDRFADKPGHLACLLRRYPAGLLEDPTCTLLPLAALGVMTSEGYAPALAHLTYGRGADGALDLLDNLTRVLTEVALRCFVAGVMPELHGQNVLVAVRRSRVESLLLRDHDTVRVHPPWLARAGLDDPGYLIKPATPNTLVNNSPQELLAWFLTLGLQLSLGAVVSALTQAFSLPEIDCWRRLGEAVRGCLGELDLPDHARDLARQELFEAESWPQKLVLRPLLERSGSGGGSMPSALGTVPNPLRQVLTQTAGRS